MRDGWIVWRVGGEAVTRRRAETRDGGLRLWLQSALRAGRKSLRWLKLFQSDPSREASNLIGRSNCESVKPRNLEPTRNGSWGFGSVEPVRVWRRPCRHRKLGRRDVELPGVGEDGMSGRNVQRKLGTTRGSPRRSRTAKTSRISRHAVKSRCACEWGGSGRLSDDGPGQHNPGRSEDPWGRSGYSTPYGGARSSQRPDSERDNRWTTRCTKGGCKPVETACMSGADLSARGNREGAI